MDGIIGDTITRLMKNPLIIMKMASVETEMLASDRHYVHNCNELRNFIGSIIDEKKEAKDANPADFLSVLLQDESY